MSIYHKLSLSVLLTLGVIPLQAKAVPAVNGNSTNVNQVVNNAAGWTTLRTVSISNLGKTRQCIATGSSDGLNPNANGKHQYRFTLSVDNLNPPVDSGFERTLEFQNQGVGIIPGNPYREIKPDNSIKEITSTGGVFFTGPGRHTIRWQARKIGGAANMTVADSSLTVVCADPEFIIIDEIPLNRIPTRP